MISFTHPMNSIISIVEKIDFYPKTSTNNDFYLWKICMILLDITYMIAWNKQEEEKIREVSYKNKEKCLLFKKYNFTVFFTVLEVG